MGTIQPTSERQARPLTKLEPEQQQEIGKSVFCVGANSCTQLLFWRGWVRGLANLVSKSLQGIVRIV